MKIRPMRVALAILVAALIVAAVWRMAPPAAGTSAPAATAATAEAPMRGAQPVPEATAAPLVAPSSSQAAVATVPQNAVSDAARGFYTSDDLGA
jgi:hypothetical protein